VFALGTALVLSWCILYTVLVLLLRIGHRFDADPDMDGHQNNADPHADPSPSFFYKLKNWAKFFTFILSTTSLQCFLISYRCVIILKIFDIILLFLRKEEKYMCLELIPIRIRIGMPWMPIPIRQNG
jgi:hypothetical protein